MKKKIIIFTSAGGNGHMATSQALIEYLSDSYDVSSVLLFTEVLKKIDALQTISNSYYVGEDIYNYFLKKKQVRAIHALYRIAEYYFWFRQKKIKLLIREYLQEHKPDLLISVFPFINSLVLKEAEKLGIPFILLPTDLDATTFIKGISNPSENFKLALSFDDTRIKKFVEKQSRISPARLITTGIPLRPDFYEPKDINSLKNSYDILQNIPVILVLMGGQGSKAILKFADALAQLIFPAHIILCAGNYETLITELETIEFPVHITRTIIGFTKKISDLMAISDLIITKSGSVSFSEAVMMEKPILLDGTSKVLIWESFNHHFLENHKFGEIIRDFDSLPALVTKILTDKNYYETLKNNSKKIEKKEGGREVKKLIATLLN